MEKAKAGDLVEIEEILLNVGQRAPQVPEDTKKVPLIQWIKGALITKQANIGDMVEIKTLIGRCVKGKLVTINPKYIHNFGENIQELADVGMELREEIKGL